MRYSGIIYDDTAAAPGLCLSFYTQGCPIHCPGCHNPGTWDPDGGHEFTGVTMDSILSGISKNGIERSFAILGGEPFAPYNHFLVAMIVQTVRQNYPKIPIWIWSGYDAKELMTMAHLPHVKLILQNCDVLVTGPFVEAKRDITLPYRGSSNQEVWEIDHEKNIWYNKLTKEIREVKYNGGQ